jgi:hypothetical protein
MLVEFVTIAGTTKAQGSIARHQTEQKSKQRMSLRTTDCARKDE